MFVQHITFKATSGCADSGEMSTVKSLSVLHQPDSGGFNVIEECSLLSFTSKTEQSLQAFSTSAPSTHTFMADHGLRLSPAASLLLCVLQWCTTDSLSTGESNKCVTLKQGVKYGTITLNKCPQMTNLEFQRPIIWFGFQLRLGCGSWLSWAPLPTGTPLWYKVTISICQYFHVQRGPEELHGKCREITL